jgi:hypothetical protein
MCTLVVHFFDVMGNQFCRLSWLSQIKVFLKSAKFSIKSQVQCFQVHNTGLQMQLEPFFLHREREKKTIRQIRQTSIIKTFTYCVLKSTLDSKTQHHQQQDQIFDFFHLLVKCFLRFDRLVIYDTILQGRWNGDCLIGEQLGGWQAGRVQTTELVCWAAKSFKLFQHIIHDLFFKKDHVFKKTFNW